MTSIRIAGLILSCGLALPGAVRADFQWLGDWVPATSGQGPATFGNPAADTATGSLSASISFNANNPIDPNAPGSQTTTLDFTRQFRVSDPSGTTTVMITADFQGNNGGLRGDGVGSLSIALSGDNLPPTPPLDFFHPDPSYDDLQSATYLLADGIYTITGGASALAELAPPPFRGDLAFGSADASFRVMVEQVPVPEPASLGLLALGAAGLIAAARRGAGGRPGTQITASISATLG